jgi:hypothetical protein
VSPSLAPGRAFPVISEILSLREIVATLGRTLERRVEYQEISDGQWRDGALAAGYNQHAVDHLSQLWRTIRTSREQLAVTDTIVQLGGRRPKTFEEFVREERETFLTQQALAA